MTSDFSYKNEELEELSAAFHQVYQFEAERQGDKRHKDNYKELSETIKQFDRVLVLHVLKALELAFFELGKEYDEEPIPLDEIWERFKEKLMENYLVTQQTKNK